MNDSELERLAAEFWADTHLGDVFPRNIEQAIALKLPVTVVKLPVVTIRAIARWLRRHNRSPVFPLYNRDLMGCLYADSGHGFIFLCGADEPEEQRLTLAHDVAHFLVDYSWPRLLVIQAMGDSIVDVLDGNRQARPGERASAVLARVRLGPHWHLLPRPGADPECDPHIACVEERADDLGRELVAPPGRGCCKCCVPCRDGDGLSRRRLVMRLACFSAFLLTFFTRKSRQCIASTRRHFWRMCGVSWGDEHEQAPNEGGPAGCGRFPQPQPQHPAEPQPLFEGESLPVGHQPGKLAPPPEIDAPEFEVNFGEPLDRTLDLETWDDGKDLTAVFSKLDQEVSQALAQENELRKQVRKVLFPQIASRPNAPKGAGVFKATRKQLQDTQANVLFNGGAEACDGTCAVHDTLPLTITQIGVCLVSYLGQQGSWGHRLYRKDLHMRGHDPLSEALESLQQREQRGGVDHETHRDQLSELGRRGIMSYAERAVLRWKSRAPWRMGHGQPAPYELLTGSGSMDFLRKSIELLEDLILNFKRFVFVPSAPGERLLLTIGHALRPLEFAVVENSVRRLDQILTKGHLRGPHRDRAEAFARDAGPAILIGVYRTYAEAPPQIFYAHADCIQDAALIAMADSLLQSQRAFPTLIDLADTVCSSLFGTEGFNSTIQSAYAKHGNPLRFLGERDTRR